MIRKLSRFYHEMKFPWRFDDNTPFPLMPLPESFESELTNLSEGFIESYKSLLTSIIDRELDHIKVFTTPELYSSINEALLIAGNRKYTISLTNESAITDISVKFYNNTTTLHMPLTYHNAINGMLKINSKYLNSLSITKKLEDHNISIEDSETFKVIFKVDAIFISPLKLVMVDENKNIVSGNYSGLPEMHLIQYEISRIFDKTENLYDLKSGLSLLNFFKGSLKFENSHWIISDIDNYLKKKD